MPDFFDDLDSLRLIYLTILKGLLDLHLLLLQALRCCLRSLFLKIYLSNLFILSFLLSLKSAFLKGYNYGTFPNGLFDPVLGSLFMALLALLEFRLTRELLLVRVR